MPQDLGSYQDHLTNSSKPYVRVSDPGAPGKMDRLNLRFFWRRVYISRYMIDCLGIFDRVPDIRILQHPSICTRAGRSPIFEDPGTPLCGLAGTRGFASLIGHVLSFKISPRLSRSNQQKLRYLKKCTLTLSLPPCKECDECNETLFADFHTSADTSLTEVKHQNPRSNWQIGCYIVHSLPFQTSPQA